ncbi:hypothetical protein V2G26_017170 [Clonostachys chloroleuca]
MSRPTHRLVHSSRQTSSGSFHAGAPVPSIESFLKRKSSQRYQTFPSQPPKTPLEQPPISDLSSDSDGSPSDDDDDDDSKATPLPVRQLLLLAYLSLSEQTALNSISPYLPEMVESMPDIPTESSGLYIGILASAFALAQLSTNFLWGYASDIVGRKPVLLLGTFALMLCFLAFGFCKSYWQLILTHIAMGMLNGNAACVPTVLGEVTDRSNQSRAFTYLPVIYSLGSITGPALGGLLVGKMGSEYPYLAPNILGAAMLASSCIVVAIWFEETLDEEDAVSFAVPSWVRRIGSWASPKRLSAGGKGSLSRSNSWSARWPRSQAAQRPLLSRSPSVGSDGDDSDDQSSVSTLNGGTPWKELLNRTTLLLLATYLIFQLSNISFNSLYPIFVATSPPAGRDLSPGKIGLTLSAAGFTTIVFQAFIFQPVKARLGNMGTYRIALLGIAVSMVLMPWVGHADDKPLFGVWDGKVWLYIELLTVLVVKNICAVGGLSSVMLLITNSAPSHNSLGTLNGVAQTLSALGRSIGPFVSGSLFALSKNIHPKGEVLSWTLFGGLALCGWVGSLFIRSESLESDDWTGSSDHLDQPDDDAV